jgi:pimeloyl-ACP methyl ester carboxylesterase
MAALKLAARKPRGLSAAVLIDGGLVAPRSAFPDWATAKRALAPPPLGGMPLEEFLDDAGRYLPVELTPEVERLVLSLMRVDRQGRIWPRLSVQHPKGLSKRIDGFVRAAVG